MKNAPTHARCGVAFASLAAVLTALPAMAAPILPANGLHWALPDATMTDPAIADTATADPASSSATMTEAAAAPGQSDAAQSSSSPAGADAIAAQSPDVSPAASNDADPLAQASVLSDADLTKHRGGESIVVGNQTLRSITSGNIIRGDVESGSISLSGNALSNFNGVGNFAINTGSQVSLQSGMNLIINLGQ